MNHGQDQRYVNLIPPAVIRDNASFTSVEIDTEIDPSLPFRILATPSVFASGHKART